MSSAAILVNGQVADCLSTLDRGLLYGDGLFETIAVENGRPRRWSRHLARLQHGCERLGITQPDTALLETEAALLCRDAQHAVLKLIITRGTGGRGYRPDTTAVPTRILQLHAYPSWPADPALAGVRACLCELRMGYNPLLAGLKHLNRLEQVLARAEWDDPAISEGLLQDQRGFLIEGTMSNVFLVSDGVLLTPGLTRCGVDGVTRTLILELAQQAGIATRVRDIAISELHGADEVFLSNSLIGIWPVAAIADRYYIVGKLTQQLQAMLSGHMDNG